MKKGIKYIENLVKKNPGKYSRWELVYKLLDKAKGGNFKNSKVNEELSKEKSSSHVVNQAIRKGHIKLASVKDKIGAYPGVVEKE